MGVDESLVRKAVKARKQYILKNLESISLKSLRLTLEDDMQLESGTLKPHKELLKALIDRMLPKAKAAAAACPAPAGDKAGEQQAEDSGEQQQAEIDEEEEEEEAPRKRRKQEGKPAKQSGPRQYGPNVKKLQGICRAATIPIPPTIYSRNKGSEEALQQALEELLEKHGLDASAGEREIGRVRARLQQQRDLDGIDTSNIIQGGRRRRAAAPASYKALVDPASDEEEEEEGDSAAGSGSEEEEASAGAAGGSASEDEEEGSRGAERRAKVKAAPAAARKRKPTADSIEAESSEEEASEEGEEADGSGAEPASPGAGNAKSPDENQAACGNAASAGKAAKGSSVQKAAAGKPKARPAASLEDSDSDGAAAQAGNGKRRLVADWSDDE